jgi:V8-like Glu-specific endopeptidase
MTNYNLGKIYKIVRKTDNALIYVGSTCEPMLCKRFDKHKQNAKTSFNRKVYRTVLDNGGWENHQILLIKVYPCDSRDELHSEEARFIRALNPIGNKLIPMRTQKEYFVENKEIIRLRYNKFRNENPETVKQWKQKERLKHIEKYKARAQKIVNCCCGSTYTYGHKTRHLQTKLHINSIPVQFNIIEEMHKNRKQYIFPPLPELKI